MAKSSTVNGSSSWIGESWKSDRMRAAIPSRTWSRINSIEMVRSLRSITFNEMVRSLRSITFLRRSSTRATIPSCSSLGFIPRNSMMGWRGSISSAESSSVVMPRTAATSSKVGFAS